MKKKTIDWDKPLEMHNAKGEWKDAFKCAVFLNDEGKITSYRVSFRSFPRMEYDYFPDGEPLRAGDFSIRNVPEKKRLKGWINVYPGCYSTVFYEKKHADRAAVEIRTACIPIDIEYYEGQGLEGGE